MLQLAIDGCRRDAEEDGGLADVAAAEFDGFFDRVPLDFVDRPDQLRKPAEIVVRGSLAGRARRCSALIRPLALGAVAGVLRHGAEGLRQHVRCDGFAVVEDGGMAEHVLQFADVARPGVVPDSHLGLGR